jgi:hypothetical protein
MADRKKATPKKPRKAATRKKSAPSHVTTPPASLPLFASDGVISPPMRVANRLDVTAPVTISGGGSLEVYRDDQQPTVAQPPAGVSIPIGWGIGPLQAATLKPDWASHVPEILQAAQDVVSLYTQLDAILGPLKRKPSPPGDNRASERAEAIRQFESDMRAAVWTSEVLREQLQSGHLSPRWLSRTATSSASLRKMRSATETG